MVGNSIVTVSFSRRKRRPATFGLREALPARLPRPNDPPPMNSLRFFLDSRFGLVAGGIGALALVSTILARPQTAAPVAAPLNGGAERIGEAVCIACHAPQNKQFSHTQHAGVFRLNPKNEKEKLSCEACHGPGSNHVKEPANRGALIGFTKEWGTPVAQQTALCLTCHEGGERMFWPGSPHASNQLGCSDCHNPMAKISATGLLKKPSINETCYTCHQQQRAEFAKRSHMPVNEGKLSCLPQSAWFDLEGALEKRLGERDLLQLPRRETWAFLVGTRAGAGKLPELPRCAWLQSRQAADGGAAVLVPTVSRQHEPSEQPLQRRPVGWRRRGAEHPHHRSLVPELPFADPREQSPGRCPFPALSSPP